MRALFCSEGWNEIHNQEPFRVDSVLRRTYNVQMVDKVTTVNTGFRYFTSIHFIHQTALLLIMKTTCRSIENENKQCIKSQIFLNHLLLLNSRFSQAKNKPLTKKKKPQEEQQRSGLWSLSH